MGTEFPKITESEITKFMERVDTTSGCWEWQGNKTYDGYGIFYSKEFPRRRSHRFSYQAFVGEIKSGMVVCHRCDNRKCVRPDHLFLGTRRDNTYDAIRKGRLRSPICGNDGSIDQIEEYFKQGISKREIARRLNVSDWTVRYHLKRKSSHNNVS